MITVEVLASAGSFWWRIRSGNRQILATSEGYSRVRDARRAARKFIASVYRTKVIPLNDLTQSPPKRRKNS